MTIPQEQILLQEPKKQSAKIDLQLSFEETSRSRLSPGAAGLDFGNWIVAAHSSRAGIRRAFAGRASGRW